MSHGQRFQSRNSAANCCVATGVPFILTMAARAYEVMKWDLPVCQMSGKCSKNKPPEIETSVTLERQPSRQSEASVRRRGFAEKVATSIFYSDGEDSDAYFQGSDAGSVTRDIVVDETRSKVRKHRSRKVNSPLSVRAPNFAQSDRHNLSEDSQDEDSVVAEIRRFNETRSNSSFTDFDHGADSDIDLHDTWTEAETAGIRDRFRKLTRSLSIAGRFKPRTVVTLPGKLQDVKTMFDRSFDSESDSDRVDGDSDPLFDCIFIAGIYHDKETDKYVPFTRNQFPEDYELPPGIEELCFPDFAHWSPHTPDRTRTYNIVLTNLNGQRTFGYCRRIQPEGDDLCLPLAMCVLTGHSRARGLFSQILVELTRLYGRSEYDMSKLYRSLRRKQFPPLGHSLELKVKIKAAHQTTPKTTSPPWVQPNRRSSLSQMWMASSNLLFRRNSRQDSTESESNLNSASLYRKRFKRPIDFRMDGAPICNLLSQKDILLLYSSVLRERRVVVISYSLSDLSTLFDGIESLLFPLSWQHTLIPALPMTRRTFLEAPTPYLIGVLVEPRTTPPRADGSVDDKKDEFWRSLKEDSLLWQDPDCFVLWLAPQTPSPQSPLPCSSPSPASSRPSSCSSYSDFQFQIKPRFNGRATSVKKMSYKGGSLMPFPPSVLDLLESRLNLFDSTFVDTDGGLEGDEISTARFVVLCETFLQMYNVIFGPLASYVTDKIYWKRRNEKEGEGESNNNKDGEEQRNFTVADYLTLKVPVDYHAFALELSEVSLFEEYIRGRIMALDIRIVSGSSKSGMILTRKVRKVKVDPTVIAEEEKKKAEKVDKFDSKSLQSLELNSCSSDDSEDREISQNDETLFQEN